MYLDLLFITDEIHQAGTALDNTHQAFRVLTGMLTRDSKPNVAEDLSN